MLWPLEHKQTMDSVKLISWPSTAVALCYWFVISHGINDILLPMVDVLPHANPIIVPQLSGSSSSTCHLLSHKSISTHAASGFYPRSRAASSVLAHLTPTLIPPTHTVVDFLQLCSRLDGDSLALLTWPTCSRESEWIPANVGPFQRGSRPICCTSVVQDSAAGV